MTKLSFKARVRFISVIVIGIALILIAKLFYLQIVDKNFYTKKADDQYVVPIGSIFNRGNILFSSKDNSLVAAATIASGYKLAINPIEIKDPESDYKILSPYLSIGHNLFISRASKKNDPYEEVADHLTEDQANKIKILHLPGVSLYKENWRFYPGGDLAAQTIGFIGYNGKSDIRTGQYGLERYYNDVLSKPMGQVYINFFAQIFSNIENEISSIEKQQGDVVTTIEPNVEHFLQSEMSDTLQKWKADLAGGIIINPKNGEIYAMVGVPSFNPNNFSKVSNISVYRNPNVQDVFEFGSVIKPLVMAAALNEGVVTPETTYLDKGVVKVDGKNIYNFDKRGRGVATMQTVLDQSLNTGMVFVEHQMGHDLFRKDIESYGIGEKTGIDLPNEASGLISNLNSPRDIEYANASFGQGIAITPIEAVRAFCSLTNGGKLITPHVVKQIKYDDGLVKNLNYPVSSDTLFSPKTSETIDHMLVHIFEYYENGKYKFPHYSVATKTGTAQIAEPNGGGYYSDRYLHSFFGFFPAYNPKFLVFLYLKDPKGVEYSSQTLIKPFINTVKFLLNYYNVPPDR